MRRILLRLARFGLVGYLTLLLLLMIFEESLIFIPTRFPRGDWRPAGLSIEEAYFQADDGTRLHGWFAPAEDPRAVILFCHGNAGNITHRAGLMRSLVHELGATTLVFDYRGFGRSEGSPNESGVFADARAARRWLAEKVGCGEREIVVMGESIGGAVAVELAAQDGAAGLVIENTFTSLPDVAQIHYPIFPVRWLMRSRFDSVAKIGNFHGPLLQSHGDVDEIVPYELGQQLHAAATPGNKQFLTIPGARHNDPRSRTFMDGLDDFLSRIGERQAAGR